METTVKRDIVANRNCLIARSFSNDWRWHLSCCSHIHSLVNSYIRWQAQNTRNKTYRPTAADIRTNANKVDVIMKLR